MEITNDQNEAVNDLLDLIVAKIGNKNREVDTIEAISTSARLAGSLLFRSFKFPIDSPKPGTVMLSEEANIKGPELVNITHAVLQNMGVAIDDSKMGGNIQQKTKSNFVDSINLLQNQALEIIEKRNLSFEQLAQSAAIATAFIIEQSKNITPETGFGTAIYYYIEGTKTYPPEFSTNLNKNEVFEHQELKRDKSKPWWKFW